MPNSPASLFLTTLDFFCFWNMLNNFFLIQSLLGEMFFPLPGMHFLLFLWLAYFHVLDPSYNITSSQKLFLNTLFI